MLLSCEGRSDEQQSADHGKVFHEVYYLDLSVSGRGEPKWMRDECGGHKKRNKTERGQSLLESERESQPCE
jgi:hypothetical protein